MNISNQTRVISLSVFVLIAAKLLYSFLIQQKSITNSFTSPPVQTATSGSVMSSILRTNIKLSSSVHRNNFVRHFFTLYDKMTELETNYNFPIHFYSDVSSTMDKAKELAKAEPNGKMFAVLADTQRKGRGTRGRVWMSGQKNMFLTVAIKQSLLPIPLNFLPLRIGTIIASCIASRVTSGAEVRLKWPNDILIDGRKVCGVLIEIEGGNLIVGIGCNVLSAPEVAAEGANGGRPATCLAQHNEEMGRYLREIQTATSTDGLNAECSSEEEEEAVEDVVASNTSQVLTLERGDFHKQLALDICQSIDSWLEAQSDSSDTVLSDFEGAMDRSPQRLRDAHNHASAQGEQVLPLGLDKDGTLMVRSVHSGAVKTLIADYLW